MITMQLRSKQLGKNKATAQIHDSESWGARLAAKSAIEIREDSWRRCWLQSAITRQGHHCQPVRWMAITIKTHGGSHGTGHLNSECQSWPSPPAAGVSWLKNCEKDFSLMTACGYHLWPRVEEAGLSGRRWQHRDFSLHRGCSARARRSTQENFL